MTAGTDQILFKLIGETDAAKHADVVTAVDVHPGGMRAVSAGGDGALRFWDVEEAACIRTLGVHDGGAVAAQFFGDESFQVLSAGRDKAIRLLDLETGAPLRTTPAASKIFAVAALFRRARSKDSHGAILLSFDSTTARIIDAESGALLQTLRSPSSGITAIAMNGAGDHAITGGWNGRVLFWSVRTGLSAQAEDAHPSEVSAVAFSRDGRLAYSADAGGRLRAWDARSGALVASVEAHSGRITALAHDAQAGGVASGGADRAVRLWSDTLDRQIANWEAEEAISALTLAHASARREVGYRTSARPLSPTLIVVGDTAGHVTFLELAMVTRPSGA